MTTKMNKDGVSVCATGQENYERFEAKRGKWYYQYDYRHTDGELFSVVLPTLDECRQKRDKWVLHKILDNAKLQEIKQNGETVLYSTDRHSMSLFFNNLIGENPTVREHYQEYIKCVAIPQMGFRYGTIELVADGVTVRTGEIRKDL